MTGLPQQADSLAVCDAGFCCTLAPEDHGYLVVVYIGANPALVNLPSLL